jgi:peptidoglycan/LPS O-acetylase OafA/YrhL
MVLVFHYSSESRDVMFASFGRYGWMGVDLFFVLSGYLIGTQLFKPIALGTTLPYWTFLRRRLLRTLPNFLAVLTVYFLFSSLRERDHLPPLWRFLSFTQNLGLDRHETGAFSHAWSLCVEEQFYLFLPLISTFLLQSKLSSRRMVWVLLGVLSFGMIARAASWIWIVEPLRNSGQDFGSLFDQYIYYPTYTRLDGLLIGVTLALIKIFRRSSWDRLLDRGYHSLMLSLTCLGLGCMLSDRKHSLEAVTFLYPVISVGFGALLVASLSPRCHFFHWKIPGVRFLAKISFGVYLVQKLVFHWCLIHLPSYGILPYSHQGFAWNLVLCIWVGALLFTFVENPFLKLRQSLETTRPKLVPVLGLALILVLMFGLTACATSRSFETIMNEYPEKLWGVSADSDTYRSVLAYRARVKQPNGLTYGDSMRDFDLNRLCVDQIRERSTRMGCIAKNDVLKEPKQNLPIHDSEGQTIPLVSYLCPDGGVVRMKPKGDPTNPKETQPSVIKAMRFFGSDRYENFSDEAFKVDNQGRPVPKWAKDMSTEGKSRYVEEWARDSHSLLRTCKPSGSP